MIYGVDIQPIATEISKLRFFLSLIVDEKIDDTKPNRGVEPLPNLEFKFVCANSLISLPRKTEGSISESLKDIEKLKNLRETYFTSYGEEKRKIEKEFIETQKRMFEHALNWGATNTQTLQLSQWNPFSSEPSPWFDPEWMFGIRNGFDIAIGNPPYVRQEKIKPLKPLLQKHGYLVYNSTSDLYTYFFETSYNILNPLGTLTFISSNKWMRSKYGEKLRQFFKKYTNIKQIIDFGGYKVFDATVDTNITIFQKPNSNDNVNQIINFIPIKEDYKPNESIAEYIRNHVLKMPQQVLGDKHFTFADEAVFKLKEKIERTGVPLANWDVNINRGIVTGLNEAFVIDTSTKERICAEDPKSAEIIKPLLRGRDIHKYCYKWAGLWLIFTRRGINIDKYPAIKAYLHRHKDKLEPKPPNWNETKDGKWKGRKPGPYKWYEIQDNIAYYTEFDKEKIVYPNMTKYLPFTYDDQKYFTNQKCYILTARSDNSFLKYLVAFLNSSVSGWLIRTTFPELQGGTREINENIFVNFPIPKIKETEQHPFINLVDKILTITKDDDYLTNSSKQAKVKEYEHQIDQMVYELYGLTPEEIEIVEKFNKK